MFYVKVAVSTIIDKTLTYEAEDFTLGQVVLVKILNRTIPGVVFEEDNFENSSALKGRESFKIRPVQQTFPFFFSLSNIEFIKWVSNYTLIPLGGVLKNAIPFSFEVWEKMLRDQKKISKNSESKTEKIFLEGDIPLNKEQTKAIKQFGSINKNFSVSLLDGVTGSGKTEVYLSVIKNMLQCSQLSKKQFLILIPEIALTTNVVARFEQYFNFTPEVWHSSTTPAKKRNIWQKAITGEPIVVIGARSAVFIPFSNLELIIIDEEHDASYKQNELGYYNARDIAVMKAKIMNIPIILTSATPSLETFLNVKKGKYNHIKLDSRFFKVKMPQISIIDMKKEKENSIFSVPLLNAIKNAITQKEQTLLFVNQRGYAPVSFCKRCGYKWRCSRCDVNLIEHKNSSLLICHHCGQTRKIEIICPGCKAEKTRKTFGLGIEMVVEEVNKAFPEARYAMLSSDTVLSKKNWENTVQSIKNGEIDIIIGTQILAKGHHFPNLTTVGVLAADQNCNSCDLRGNEKTYQLLHQVAGRAGREKKRGTVFLQTYEPQNPVLQALEENDRDAFYESELTERRDHNMPPFFSLIAIILRGKNEIEVEKKAKQLAQTFPISDIAVLLGPAPAPIFKLKGFFRYRFLIKIKRGFQIQHIIKRWIGDKKTLVTVSVDVQPYEFF